MEILTKSYKIAYNVINHEKSVMVYIYQKTRRGAKDNEDIGGKKAKSENVKSCERSEVGENRRESCIIKIADRVKITENEDAGIHYRDHFRSGCS